MKTSDLTIWPTPHPTAAAASAAVRVPSGKRWTSTVSPEASASLVNLSTASARVMADTLRGNRAETPAEGHLPYVVPYTVDHHV